VCLFRTSFWNGGTNKQIRQVLFSAQPFGLTFTIERSTKRRAGQGIDQGKAEGRTAGQAAAGQATARQGRLLPYRTIQGKPELARAGQNRQE